MYKNHPQLLRSRKFNNPTIQENHYLAEIYKEAQSRNYFDITKLTGHLKTKADVTSGQIQFELEHLQKKPKKDPLPIPLAQLKKINHPIFRIIKDTSNAGE